MPSPHACSSPAHAPVQVMQNIRRSSPAMGVCNPTIVCNKLKTTEDYLSLRHFLQPEERKPHRISQKPFAPSHFGTVTSLPELKQPDTFVLPWRTRML